MMLHVGHHVHLHVGHHVGHHVHLHVGHHVGHHVHLHVGDRNLVSTLCEISETLTESPHYKKALYIIISGEILEN